MKKKINAAWSCFHQNWRECCEALYDSRCMWHAACVAPLQERPAVLAQGQYVPVTKALAKHRGTGFGISLSHIQWEPQCCSPKSSHVDSKCKMVPPHFFLHRRRNLTASAVQESLTEMWRADSMSCVTVFLSFIFGAARIQNSKSWRSRYPLDLLPPLEQSFSVLWLVPFVPQKQSHACTMARIYGRQQKAMTRLYTFCYHLFAMPKKGHLLVPAWSFIPGGAWHPLPNVLQERKWYLPGWPRRSLHNLWVPRATNVLLTKSRCYSSTLVKATPFQKLRVWVTLIVCKKPVLISSPNSPLCGLRGFLLVWIDIALSKPFSLSLSHFFPLERIPSSPQHGSFSLPQFTSAHLTPVTLSPYNCGNLSPNLHISFLGVPSDLISI